MLILGLLLVVLSAAAVIVLLAYNGSGGTGQTVAVFGWDISGVTPLGAFLSGVALALIFCVGLWMVVSTGRQRRLARARYLEERRKADAAAAERDELAEQLAREREAAVPPQDTAARKNMAASDRELYSDHPTHRAR